MNTDNNLTPDDGYRKTWQQAFDEAAETPPPRVWNAIERQLDTDNRARIIPLWAYVKPWATGVAASVAFVLTGWWAWQAWTPNAPTAQVINRQATTVAPETGQLNPAPAAASTKVNQPAVPNSINDHNTLASTGSIPEQRLARLAHSKTVVSRMGQSRFEPQLPQQSSLSGQPPALVAFGQTNVIERTALTAFVQPDESDRVVLSVEGLSGKAFRNRQLAIQRVVWFRNDDVISEETVLSRAHKREKWASLSVMPSSFNPTVNIQAQPTAASYPNAAYSSAAYLSVANRAAPSASSLRSEAGAAVTVQIGAGAQLNDRWSLEAGVGYLQARSTVVSLAQVTQFTQTGNMATGQTLYTAAIQNAINRKSASASSVANDKNNTYVSTALYDSQSQGSTRSDYSFVQVPVQVGYQLRPRRKLGLSLLGGLLTNWFVRNSVGETLVVKPSDNVYKEMTLAGTAGARLRYRSSPRWSASMAGVYQQSLQLGTQSDVNLETRPHTVGVSFGMDYHF